MLEIDVGGGKIPAKPAPASPKPPTSAPKTNAPQLVSEHGQGGGSSSSDTGKKPTQKETQTGYATPVSTQPKPTTPQITSEHGQGGGSSSSDTGAKPTQQQAISGYTAPTTSTSSGTKGTKTGGASPVAVEISKANGEIPKPKVEVSAKTETKPIVKITPIGEWGVVKFETSASATVTVSSRDARGRSPLVEFDPHNGVVSVSTSHFAFSDKGTVSAQVGRFQDPAELLLSHYGAVKERPPASTKADKTIVVSVGNQWARVEPEPTEYHITATIEDGHLAFDFSASRELEIKDSRGVTASVEYEVATKMTLLETHVPGKPSRFPKPISEKEAVEILKAAGLGVGIVGIAVGIRARGGGEAGAGEVVAVPDG